MCKSEFLPQFSTNLNVDIFLQCDQSKILKIVNFSRFGHKTTANCSQGKLDKVRSGLTEFA